MSIRERTSGYRQHDKAINNNGWPTEGITELLMAQYGIGELQILLPDLANLSQRSPHWIVWISPPHLPYAPALYAASPLSYPPLTLPSILLFYCSLLAFFLLLK